MRVFNVAVNIRYAKEIEGAWKTVEVGAEATVEEGEQWTLCQQGLFAQLREVWAMGKNGRGPEPAENGHEKLVEVGTWEELASAPSPAKAHWCSLHEQPFKRFEKDSKFWYSHKTPDGWCREGRS
jgi:hypothetical protein